MKAIVIAFVALRRRLLAYSVRHFGIRKSLEHNNWRGVSPPGGDPIDDRFEFHLSPRSVSDGQIDLSQALQVARHHAGSDAELTLSDDQSPGLYDFDAGQEYLFVVHRPSVMRVGSAEYIAVSRATGQVRSGDSGE